MQAFVIVIIICIAIIIYVKKKINKLSLLKFEDALLVEDYDKALEALESSYKLSIIDEIEYNSKLLKVYFMSGNKSLFLKQINTIKNTTYRKDIMPLLVKWYHHCVAYQVREFADEFLLAIKQHSNDYQFTYYQMIYDIIFNKLDKSLMCNNYLKDSSLSLFDKGVCYYMYGYMYDLEKNKENALKCYENALVNFDQVKSGIYYRFALNYIKEYGNESCAHYHQFEKKAKRVKGINYEQYIIKR